MKNEQKKITKNGFLREKKRQSFIFLKKNGEKKEKVDWNQLNFSGF